MKLRLQKTALLAASAALLSVFPAYAADVEGRANMTDAGIYGWAWNTEDTNDVITLEMRCIMVPILKTPRIPLRFRQMIITKN
ncbi:MAG: hypothetical protein ACLTKI_03395 [Lachnospiraceae bacterium]